jgi:hypothetical protein
VESDDVNPRLVTQGGIARLLSFLPYFEDAGTKFGEGPSVEVVDKKTIDIGPSALADKASEFLEACYEEKFVQDVNWQRWGTEREVELRSEAFSGRADLATIVRLLTLHFRMDHFSDGHLLSVMRDGTILAILRRLSELRGSGWRGKVTTIVDKRNIDNAIADVCVRIIQEPLLYFSEADVQQMLVQALNGVGRLGAPLETSVWRGKDSKGKYRTGLVHREYGAGEGRRTDVIIFDPEDVPRIDGTNLTIKGEYLNPLYAFEIGTEKTADAASHLRKDIGKLKRVKRNGAGYVIHFFKDSTSTRTGAPRRQATEDKIDQSYREAFSSMQPAGEDNIRILAILLRTGRDQTRMLGKCEIFDRQRRDWVKVNVNNEDRIRAAIQKQLV